MIGERKGRRAMPEILAENKAILLKELPEIGLRERREDIVDCLLERITELFDPEDIYPETAFDEMRERFREEGRQEMRETTHKDRAEYHNE